MSGENKKYQIHVTKSNGENKGGYANGDSSRDKKVDPNKYKDFDKVYKSYADSIYKRPWSRFQFHQSKNRKVTLYILVILIVVALVVMEYVKE
jgi:hypothetical protein